MATVLTSVQKVQLAAQREQLLADLEAAFLAKDKDQIIRVGTDLMKIDKIQQEAGILSDPDLVIAAAIARSSAAPEVSSPSIEEEPPTPRFLSRKAKTKK